MGNAVRNGWPNILLFDIDGTLIESGGAGGGALLEALAQEFGCQRPRPVPVHGRTDLGILRDLLREHGWEPTTQRIERLRSRYIECLPASLRSRSGRVLPGVRDLVGRLANRPQVVLGLLTGNMARSARMKLEHFDLWRYFSLGVFGDAASQRGDLAGPTRRLLEERFGSPLNPRRVTIVGDTPLDIELARLLGCRCLAVCTGGFSAEALDQADWVVADLSDVVAVENWLLDQSRGSPAWTVQ